MKLRLLTVALLCSFLAVTGFRAEDGAPKGKDKEPETELGTKMEKIGGAMRRLSRQLEDASKNDDSLRQLAIVKQNAEAALTLEPAKKAEIPADKQAKFVADYQAKMKDFIANVARVEAALKAGNNVEAKALLGALNQDKKEGHTEFQKKEKREKKKA